MEGRILTNKPVELFRDLVDEAIDHQGVDSSEDSSFYLVQLLDRFVSPEGRYGDVGRGPDHPLGRTLLAANEKHGLERFVLLRFTGDMALFLSGFFSESLPRRGVAEDYYNYVGGTAYGSAADCCSPRRNAPLFEELSHRFESFVEVLREVSEQCMVVNSGNLLRLYERWLAEESPRAAEALARHGITAPPKGAWVN